MSQPKDCHAVGVDLGGTFIKAGVVSGEGKIVFQNSRPTEAAKGRDAILGNIVTAADDVRRGAGLAWRQVCALGLGSPGVFDHGRGGLVYNCPNLPVLENQPLLTLVAERLGQPGVYVTLENDANAAAYGEAWVGAGRDVTSLVLFTLGTGVGGGIVLDGKVWRGAFGFAGELGHQTIIPDGPKCGCGNRGCLEALASATALVRRFHETVAAGRASRLAERARRGEAITGKAMDIAAREGDALCRELIEETGVYLGIGAANMINVLNPEMIAFGGGMIGSGDMLLEPLRREAARRAIPAAYKMCRIVFAELGNHAGLIGAAGCALNESATSAS